MKSLRAWNRSCGQTSWHDRERMRRPAQGSLGQSLSAAARGRRVRACCSARRRDRSKLALPLIWESDLSVPALADEGAAGSESDSLGVDGREGVPAVACRSGDPSPVLVAPRRLATSGAVPDTYGANRDEHGPQERKSDAAKARLVARARQNVRIGWPRGRCRC